MPTIDMIATGNRIRDLRDQNHLKTRDMMDIFGFNNPVAINKWMRGETLPTIDNLVILADLFGITINDIIVINRTTTAVA